MLIANASAASIFAVSDVSSDAWYAPAVDRLLLARALSGRADDSGKNTGLFRPDDTVTLAEALKISLRASKQPLPASGVPSNSSAHGTWAAGYVQAAEMKKFKTFRDNTLDVFKNATRAEAVQIVVDAFHLRPQSTGNGTLNDTMTRGEFAVMVASLLPGGLTPIVTTPTPDAGSSASSEPSTPTQESPAPFLAATHKLIATSANMRSGASMEYRVVKILRSGEPLLLVSEPVGAWGEFQLADGTTGFLILTSVSRLKPESAPTIPTPPTPAPETVPAPQEPASTPAPTVDTSAANGSLTGPVNLRVLPDITSRSLGSFPAGTPIIILDQSNTTWTYIRLLNGKEGYVGAKFVMVGK